MARGERGGSEDTDSRSPQFLLRSLACKSSYLEIVAKSDKPICLMDAPQAFGGGSWSHFEEKRAKSSKIPRFSQNDRKNQECGKNATTRPKQILKENTLFDVGDFPCRFRTIGTGHRGLFHAS
jgi:hypothetical protein